MECEAEKGHQNKQIDRLQSCHGIQPPWLIHRQARIIRCSFKLTILPYEAISRVLRVCPKIVEPQVTNISRRSGRKLERPGGVKPLSKEKVQDFK